MSPPSLTVLVLGVGGNVSQGILKALSASGLLCRVVAGCVSPLSLGLYLADRAFVTPYADDPAFAGWLERVCTEEQVDAVLSGVEPVLDALAPTAEALRERTGARCLVSSPSVLAVGRDKLVTARWLHEHGFASPRSADAADAEGVRNLAAESGLPLVAKPKQGKASEGVAIVRDQAELDLLAGRPELMVQEYLPGDDEEFTVGCVCDSAGELRGSLAMRRRLQGGTTSRAEAGDFPEVRSYAEAIARELRPAGPLNVQVRMVAGQPVAFELNVRFSGTTPVRARLGFNEVEATLRHYLLGEPLRLPRVTTGTVLRYWNEAYVSESARERLTATGRLDDPRAHPLTVEDWGMGG